MLSCQVATFGLVIFWLSSSLVKEVLEIKLKVLRLYFIFDLLHIWQRIYSWYMNDDFKIYHSFDYTMLMKSLFYQLGTKHAEAYTHS